MENSDKIIATQSDFITDLVNELATISQSLADVNDKVSAFNKQRLELSLPEPQPVVELPTPIEAPIKDGSSIVKISQADIDEVMANDPRIVIKDSIKEPELYYVIYFKGREHTQLSKKETLENFKSILNTL